MNKRALNFLGRIVLLATVLLSSLTLANGRRVPTIDDLLMVKSVGGAQISPDGPWVAYTVNQTDFKQDAFVTQIWLANTATGETFQLTHSEKSSTNPQWSPDGKWLAFLSSRLGDKNQIFVINPLGGEAIPLTKSETAVSNFAWSKNGKTMAFTAAEAASPTLKDRKEHFGDYEVVRKEYGHVHLWTFDVAEAMKESVTGQQRTKGKEFSVGAFAWSPDDTKIALAPRSIPISFRASRRTFPC